MRWCFREGAVAEQLQHHSDVLGAPAGLWAQGGGTEHAAPLLLSSPTYKLIDVFCQNPSDLFHCLYIPAKWWMLLLRVIKEKLYIYPKGIRYDLIMFSSLIVLFLFPFHMNSADITLSNAFLPLFFYQVPCCFRAISCKLMVLMALGLHGSCYCCALWAGVGLCVPTGRLCCKHEPLGKDTCQQAPKSLQPSSRTVVYSAWLQWTDLRK